MNISELLVQGENSAIEFKQEMPRAESLAKEMIAFANTQGGTLLLGVADNAEVIGIDNVQGYEETVMNIARNNVIPALDVSYQEQQYQGKCIIAIDIPKGKDKPYQSLQHQFLVRVGSTNRVATQAELMRLFQQSGVFHYDALAIEHTSIKQINLYKISDYFDNYQIDFAEEEQPEILLKNTDILTDTGQATIGGLLVFGLNPQKYLPSACLSFAHFAGDSLSEELIDKQNRNVNTYNKFKNCSTQKPS